MSIPWHPAARVTHHLGGTEGDPAVGPVVGPEVCHSVEPVVYLLVGYEVCLSVDLAVGPVVGSAFL